MISAKKIVYFTILLFSFFTFYFACSDDAEEEFNNEFQTFLEKHDGTEWLLSNDDITVYIRINNDMEKLIEQWRFDHELNCFIYNSNIMNPGNYQIKENSRDTLIIDCDIILGDCDCMTFFCQEDNLMVEIKISEWEDETVYFDPSPTNVDNLEKCIIEDDFEGFKFYN